MSFDPKKYPVTFVIDTHEPSLSADQVPKEAGATHALFWASIVYPPDGSLSILFGGVDGRKADQPDDTLEDNEWFKVWMLLTARLAKSETLGESKRMLCRVTHEALAASVRGGN